MSGIQFRIVPAPAALQRDIACFRLTVADRPGEMAVRVCPNTNPGIVFQQHKGASAIKDIVVQSGRTVQVPTLFAYGQITDLSVMYFRAPYTTIQVVFKPHAISTILGLDASQLANSSIGAEQFGASSLNDALLTTDNMQKQVKLLSDFLLAKQQAIRSRDVLIEQILTFIDQNISTITIKAVRDRFVLSERQLERKFKQRVGISPQVYIRIKRINAAFHLMDSGAFERLSDIAHELNFHDQSHFIRDIKMFSGVTPKSITQKVHDFHHDQVGSSYIYQYN